MKILFRALTLSGLLATTSMAAELSVSVFDQNGKAVSNAVVYVSQIDGQVPQTRPMLVEVDQIDETFVPHVRAATVGSTVSFPNSDHVRHHVYSFSPAKSFELKLFAGIPANPVVFDKAGIAVLGCNIHDAMTAWVVVVDTPFYGRSAGAGPVAMGQVPAGNYRLRVWHPSLPVGAPAADQPLVVGSADTTITFRLSGATAP